MVAFGLFIAYQLYRYTYTHSIWLLLFSVLDLGVIALTWHEYRYIKQRMSARLTLPPDGTAAIAHEDRFK